MSDGPLLNDVTRAFAEAHRNEDVRDLALKTKRTADLDLPAALSDDEAITGTRPAAMPSMTLTDSRSAIDGCTSRSPERSNAGMSAFRWNPIEAGRDNSRPAIRCNLFLSGPVPAITNSMSCA